MSHPPPSGRRPHAALPEKLLWPYQRQALRDLEQALHGGQRQVLAILAPGTGKTRLGLVLLHRLLSENSMASGALVVATELLRQQTMVEFEHLEIEPGRPLASFYANDASSRLRIVTQDEAASTAARPFLVFDDVVPTAGPGSNPRSGADAHIRQIVFAGTSTPELTGVYGQPIFHYGYRRAVLDGFLVDHDPPRQLTADGIENLDVRYKAPAATPDAITPQHLDDACAATSRQLRDEDFLRRLASRLVEQLDPRVPGTTLLYCLDDPHALQVTDILKSLLTRTQTGLATSVVLTATDATAAKTVQALREAGDRSRVVVSGASLTHGVNLPAVDRLVFLCPVQRRSQFDRMLGLAARPYPNLYGPGHDKQVFHVLDALGTCQAMAPFATIRPVVKRPRASFQQLVEEFRKIEDAEQRRLVLEEWIGKLRRQVRPFREHLDREFRAASGGRGVDDLLGYLNSVTPSEARIFFLNNRKLAPMLDEYLPGG